MKKKNKLGDNPLDWIDSTAEKIADTVKDGERRTITKTPQEGLKAGWTRATFIVKESQLEKIKDLAYWDRKQVKEIIDEALEGYFKGKTIKPRERT